MLDYETAAPGAANGTASPVPPPAAALEPEGRAAPAPVAVVPRWELAADQFPPRVERYVLPEPYQHVWVDLWTNPSDAEYRAVAEQGDAAALARLIRAWSLVDAARQPLPITPETTALLPSDVAATIYYEWRQRRFSPLQLRKPPGSGPTTPTSTAPSTATPTTAP